jgi:hypothetical protein
MLLSKCLKISNYCTDAFNEGCKCLKLRLATELPSEKCCGIDLERFLLFRGRKCSFRGMPRSTEESIPKLGTERKYEEKLVFRKSKNNLTQRFVRTSKVLKCFKTEFREFAGVFVPRNRIPRVCFYFCYTERNSEHFSLPRNSKSLLLFLFHCSKHFFLPRNGVEQNSERFLFHGTAGIRPERTKIVSSIQSSAEYFFLFGKFQPYLQYRNLSAPSFGWATHSGEFFIAHFYSNLRFPTRAF